MKKNILILLISAIIFSCEEKESFDAMGRFEADDVVVSAESAGRIVRMNVSEGGEINKDDIIAVTDTALLVLEKKQTEAQIKAILSSRPDIQSEAASLRSEIERQQREKRRYEKLVAERSAPQKQLDDINAEIDILEKRLEGLLSRLDINNKSIDNNAQVLHVRVEQINEQINRCYISSPISGTVINKYTEEGEYVQPGKPLFRVADMNKIYLRCYFTSDQLAKIKLGDKLHVVADYGGNESKEYEGIVTNIASESEFTPKTIQTDDSRANLVYAVKIAVKNDGSLKIGFTGKVYL